MITRKDIVNLIESGMEKAELALRIRGVVAEFEGKPVNRHIAEALQKELGAPYKVQYRGEVLSRIEVSGPGFAGEARRAHTYAYLAAACA